MRVMFDSVSAIMIPCGFRMDLYFLRLLFRLRLHVP